MILLHQLVAFSEEMTAVKMSALDYKRTLIVRVYELLLTYYIDYHSNHSKFIMMRTLWMQKLKCFVPTLKPFLPSLIAISTRKTLSIDLENSKLSH